VVCPYHLTQELARWCDVIIGDYNYFFDTSAFLYGLAVQNQWRIGLAVDEAHNLVSRARDMYSATLDPQALAAAVPHASPRARAQLRGLQRAWKRLSADRREPYFVLEEVPRSLLGPLLRVVAAIADDLVAMPPAPDSPLLRFHFDALQFARLADAFGTHSLFDLTHTETGTDICIRNVSPAPFLAPRFAACATAILVSATLSPGPYYGRVLGMPAAAAWLDVDSPFVADQLEVRIERRISTRYRDRQRSLVPIADLLARQYAVRPGNYLAFFASFDYLQAVLRAVVDKYPHIATWEQTPAMSATAREEFLAQFTATGCGIGFAVLGGIFAEGIDLPGERLVGAFIATLGLPPVNGINAEMERRMQSLFNAGYDYAYLYPGLQKVVQAAGRVIRTEADRGTVHLIDDRYMNRNVRDLLPRWWHVTCS
ncbi:MAG: ATP-dependent DNA helicase, partial [Pseudomonadota bacterium]|nr:ATP-dependent DNA helicase [Pseudomonadota bacterium]